MNIITKTNIAETRFLNLVSTSYEDKKGKIKEWVSAERPGNQNAVVIVATVPRHDSFGHNTNDDRLVVIKEFRVPLQGYEIGLPAGLIDPGQTVEETAIRELKEETGLDVVRFIRPVTPFVYNSPGMSNEAVSYAFVEAKGEPSKEHLEASEEIETIICTREQIDAFLKSAQDSNTKPMNLFIGAKAWLIFERFVTYGDI